MTRTSHTPNHGYNSGAGRALASRPLAAAIACATIAAAAWLPFAHAAPVYRVENADGTVTFTDRPAPGAKRTPVPVDTGNNYHSERPAYEEPSVASEYEQINGYTGISVTSPANEANFHSNEGNVPITFTIEPSLRAGDSVRIMVDGKATGLSTGADGLGQLTGIERGAHSLVIEVLGPDKQRLTSSPTITFFVHKTSVLLGPKARPNGPARRPAGAVLTPPPRPRT